MLLHTNTLLTFKTKNAKMSHFVSNSFSHCTGISLFYLWLYTTLLTFKIKNAKISQFVSNSFSHCTGIPLFYPWLYTTSTQQPYLAVNYLQTHDLVLPRYSPTVPTLKYQTTRCPPSNTQPPDSHPQIPNRQVPTLFYCFKSMVQNGPWGGEMGPFEWGGEAKRLGPLWVVQLPK